LAHAQYNVNTIAPWYLRDGGTSTLTTDPAPVQVTSTTVADWVNNPATYYYDATGAGDGKYAGLAAENSYLWDDNIKTVYDPCPAGWRVPKDGLWDNIGWTATPNFGYSNNTFGGYYSCGGFRYRNTGVMRNVNASGYYWSTSASGTDGLILFLDTGNSIHPSITATRSTGCSIRCIKE